MIEELIAFIDARITEDEHLAREAMAQLRCGCHSGNEVGVWEFNGEDAIRHSNGLHEVITGACHDGTFIEDETGAHIAHHDPARVLRDVEAKRAILDGVRRHLDPHPGRECDHAGNEWAECVLHTAVMGRVSPDVLPMLAMTWSDHFDYPKGITSC